MSSNIHPTAVIGADVKIGDGVKIGPYCVIDGNVDLGDNVELVSHVYVTGNTKVGSGTTIYPFASIGAVPQDLKFGGEDSRLEIGQDCNIREHVTMNPGTSGGGMVTRVGNQCLVMVGAHVAHDCQIGNNCILVNNVTLGGHVEIDDFAIIGGMTAVHQFVRIGQHAMVGGASALGGDVIPFGVARGNLATLDGLNLVGLKRRSFDREEIHDLRQAYRMLIAPEGTVEEKIADVEQLFGNRTSISEVLRFMRIKTAESRGLCMPKRNGGA